MNKAELMTGLQKEYQDWQGLLDQIGLAHMVQPGVAGHWSIKDIIAHLTGWRRRTVARLQAAGRGDPEPSSPWPSHLQNDDAINAWIYEANHKRPLQEILHESDQVFNQLLAAIEDLPDQAFTDVQHYFPWWQGNTLTSEAFFAHFHEEHEPDMRTWLAQMNEH